MVKLHAMGPFHAPVTIRRTFSLWLAGLLVTVFAVSPPSFLWARPPATDVGPATATKALPLRFGELYVFGLVFLAPGGGTLTYPDQRPPVVCPKKEVRAPIGAVISTTADESARLRLECGSFIDLGPRSRVVLRAWHLELLEGPCLFRHVGSPFPLKLGGIATLTMQPNSVLEVLREGDSLTVRVQAGLVNMAGLAEELRPGENAVASSSGVAVRIPLGPAPRTWRDHGTSLAADGLLSPLEHDSLWGDDPADPDPDADAPAIPKAPDTNVPDSADPNYHLERHDPHSDVVPDEVGKDGFQQLRDETPEEFGQ